MDIILNIFYDIYRLLLLLDFIREIFLCNGWWLVSIEIYNWLRVKSVNGMFK